MPRNREHIHHTVEVVPLGWRDGDPDDWGEKWGEHLLWLFIIGFICLALFGKT